jgi:hypothetical protein
MYTEAELLSLCIKFINKYKFNINGKTKKTIDIGSDSIDINPPNTPTMKCSIEYPERP